ncbi:MAG: WGR domain-containing protein [Firmicutes bacterium]|nr:WGR domain-containing protein [Bacillota bacterium]
MGAFHIIGILLIGVTALFVLPLLVYRVIYMGTKRENDPRDFVMRTGKGIQLFFLGVAVILAVIVGLTLFTDLGANNADDQIFALIVAMTLAFVLFMILLVRRLNIIVKGDNVTVSTIFGRAREFDFRNIAGAHEITIDGSMGTLSIKVIDPTGAEDKFSVRPYMTGLETFLLRMIEQRTPIQVVSKRMTKLLLPLLPDDWDRMDIPNYSDDEQIQFNFEENLTRLVFVDGTSDKFWHINYFYDSTFVHYGRNGTMGQVDVKIHTDEDVSPIVAKQISEKLRKGYKHYNKTSHHDDALKLLKDIYEIANTMVNMAIDADDGFMGDESIAHFGAVKQLGEQFLSLVIQNKGDEAKIRSLVKTFVEKLNHIQDETDAIETVEREMLYDFIVGVMKLGGVNVGDEDPTEEYREW